MFDAASEDRTAGERGTVAVAVVPAALVEEYLGLFTESGFQPLSFEVAAESVARAVVPRASREAALILRLGSDRTHLIFARGRSAVFATTVEFGGRSLTDSLVRGLGIGEDEAERLKREHGLAPSQEHRKAAALLRERLAALTTELARYIGYWNTHHAPASQNGHGPSALEPSGAPARGIARVLLCGGGANLRAFAPFLSAALDLPVSFGNVWTNCFSFDDYIPALPRDESFGYCAAVGLALRGVG